MDTAVVIGILLAIAAGVAYTAGLESQHDVVARLKRAHEALRRFLARQDRLW